MVEYGSLEGTYPDTWIWRVVMEHPHPRTQTCFRRLVKVRIHPVAQNAPKLTTVLALALKLISAAGCKTGDNVLGA
jgi:hypothetical protein